MFNLLKKEDKVKIGKQYKIRLLAVILCFTLFSMVVLVIFLLPSYYVSMEKESSTLQNYNILTASINDKIKNNPGETVDSINQRIISVASKVSGEYIYSIIGDIISKKTSSIVISGISVSNLDSGQKDFIIKGAAKDRESLVSFSEALKSDSLFKNVDLPVSSLANDANIFFSIKISIEP